MSITTPSPRTASAMATENFQPIASYGLLADWTGLGWTFAAMALLTVAVVPLALPLRSHLAG